MGYMKEEVKRINGSAVPEGGARPNLKALMVVGQDAADATRTVQVFLMTFNAIPRT